MSESITLNKHRMNRSSHFKVGIKTCITFYPILSYPTLCCFISFSVTSFIHYSLMHFFHQWTYFYRMCIHVTTSIIVLLYILIYVFMSVYLLLYSLVTQLSQRSNRVQGSLDWGWWGRGRFCAFICLFDFVKYCPCSSLHVGCLSSVCHTPRGVSGHQHSEYQPPLIK